MPVTFEFHGSKHKRGIRSCIGGLVKIHGGKIGSVGDNGGQSLQAFESILVSGLLGGGHLLCYKKSRLVFLDINRFIARRELKKVTI